MLFGERCNQPVIRVTDVLILIDQNPVEAPEHLVPHYECGRFIAPEKGRGLPRDVVECLDAGIGSDLCGGNVENPT